MEVLELCMTAPDKTLNMETENKLAGRSPEDKGLTALFRKNYPKLALIIHVSRETIFQFKTTSL